VPASRRNFPQSIHWLLGESPAPQDDGLAIDRQLLGNRAIGLSLGGSQHDPAAQGDLLRSTVDGHPLLLVASGQTCRFSTGQKTKFPAATRQGMIP
jgi:hypothetical protein